MIFSHPPTPGLISIIIPTGNDPEGLRVTLDSLAIQVEKSVLVEILVVNDGGHASVSAVCQDRPMVREIIQTPQGGAYKARNQGVKDIRGEFIGFLDANVIPAQDWIGQARKAMETFDYVAGPIDLPSVPHPTTVQLVQILREFSVRHDFEKRGGFTANLVVSRRIFQELGGFEELLRSGGDYELGSRIQRSGLFRCVYADELRVVHPFRSFTETMLRRRRIVDGVLTMIRLFPDRFPEFNQWWLLLLKCCIPPRRIYSPGDPVPSLRWDQWLACYFCVWSLELTTAYWLIFSNHQKKPYIDPIQKTKAEDLTKVTLSRVGLRMKNGGRLFGTQSSQ